MIQSQAEQIVMRLIKPIYRFTKNRCASIEDAEDITQEICLKLFRVLIVRDDISEPDKFDWTIAHNVLANYYRSRSRHGASVPIHGIADILPGIADFANSLEEAEMASRLHREIAYLSKTQRRIVIMFYFEGKRQHEIAQILGLPLGTVKWHLSEAKNELQKRLDNMKKASEAQFNPIEFSVISTNGSAGSMGGNGVYLRSSLAQNILFLTRSEAMSINDIADCLGVSPVYVESEVDFLEQNVFILKRGKKYITNVLIDIPTTEYNRLISDVYEKAADMFAPELYDALAENVNIGENGVICPGGDLNFVLWALVPYIIAHSGTPGNAVTFEQAATIRPDGGVNICACTVKNSDAKPIKYSDSFSKMRGPSRVGDEIFKLWLIDSEWGGSRIGNYLPDLLNRDLACLKTMFEGSLSDDDALRMTQRGYISRKQHPSGGIIDTLSIVWLSHEADERLRGIADSLREKYQAEFEKLKSLLVSDTPEHMKKARTYGMQHRFFSDGLYIIYALNKLVESGKLTPPSEDQRNSLGAVLVTE